MFYFIYVYLQLNDRDSFNFLYWHVAKTELQFLLQSTSVAKRRQNILQQQLLTLQHWLLNLVISWSKHTHINNTELCITNIQKYTIIYRNCIQKSILITLRGSTIKSLQIWLFLSTSNIWTGQS